jgi:hypothetical protein
MLATVPQILPARTGQHDADHRFLRKERLGADMIAPEKAERSGSTSLRDGSFCPDLTMVPPMRRRHLIQGRARCAPP